MPYAQFATSWSPDGETLAFNYEHPETKFDIYLLELRDEARPFLRTEFNESAAMFSPDGRWLAYQSDESGRNEVYVRPFPGPGEKRQVSREGGSEPLWAPGGGELFYRNPNGTFAVAMETNPELKLGEPALLYNLDLAIPAGLNIPSYDVAPDGQRFLAIRESDDELSRIEITVVLNWFQELERLVPTN